MMLKILGFIIVFAALLSSCDPLVSYSFRLDNNSSHPLQVEYKVGIIDTSFTLGLGQQVLFYKEQRISKEASDYYLDSLWLFIDFNVWQNDSTHLNFAIKDRKRWDFEQKSTIEGAYSLRLSDPDFQ
ncbi:MAG TPA: hypothetical protein ENJ82_01920 [Bacteroidetes bacterium]|nr:hypothetical protein [Bacteroidota bacterium]